MSPRIIKLLEDNKREHNQGPISPITRKEVKRAGGSLERVYAKRARYDPFAQDVMTRIKKLRKK